MNIKYIDTTTPQGMERAVLFEANNPDYKLVSGRLDFTWIFEKKEIVSLGQKNVSPEETYWGIELHTDSSGYGSKNSWKLSINVFADGEMNDDRY